MKALVLKGSRDTQITELQMPIPGPGQVLVKNSVCAVCNATDTKMYTGKHALVTFPSVFGHEGAGIVAAVGEGVTCVQLGDAVLGAGYPAQDGLGSFWGQYSEYGITDAAEIIPIPEGVSLEHASLAHMLGEALNALTIANLPPCEHVVIIGCGAVGLSLLTVLRHAYPASLIVLDIDNKKLEIAKKLGATHAINPGKADVEAEIEHISEGHGVNFVFEAVGSKPTYDMSFSFINNRGVIIPFGIIEGTMELPFRKLYSKQLQMRWVRSVGDNGRENKRQILRMMQRGLIAPEAMITGRYPLSQFPEAAEAILRGEHIRVLMQI